MKKIFPFLLLSLFVLAGCKTTSAFIPKANRSTYFATRSAGFMMDVIGSKVKSTYYLSLAILKPLEHDGYMEVQFENPANKAKPIVVGNILKAHQRLVDIQSPVVTGIKRLHFYDVTIRLYADSHKDKLLGTHEQKVSTLYSEKSIQKLSKT